MPNSITMIAIPPYIHIHLPYYLSFPRNKRNLDLPAKNPVRDLERQLTSVRCGLIHWDGRVRHLRSRMVKLL